MAELSCFTSKLFHRDSGQRPVHLQEHTGHTHHVLLRFTAKRHTAKKGGFALGV
jgi:hypothetical protein